MRFWGIVLMEGATSVDVDLDDRVEEVVAPFGDDAPVIERSGPCQCSQAAFRKEFDQAWVGRLGEVISNLTEHNVVQREREALELYSRRTRKLREHPRWTDPGAPLSDCPHCGGTGDATWEEDMFRFDYFSPTDWGGCFGRPVARDYPRWSLPDSMSWPLMEAKLRFGLPTESEELAPLEREPPNPWTVFELVKFLSTRQLVIQPMCVVGPGPLGWIDFDDDQDLAAREDALMELLRSHEWLEVASIEFHR